MPTDRFFIAPYDSNSGLQRDKKPFMITDQAFASLNNAYCWRGRVRKRFGSRWFGDTQLESRLRVNLGNTGVFGSLSGTVPGDEFNIGQMFSVGTQMFTVITPGAVQPMLATGPGAGTFSTTNGGFSITGTGLGAGVAVYWYPSLPVMGMASFENAAINNEPLIAFDTRFSYQYSAGWFRITGETNAGDSVWSGDNADFFWFTTYTGVDAFTYALFVTNFNQLEPNYMRYLVGTTWTTFRPKISTVNGVYLNSARILIPFKNRMLAFNTWEGTDIASQKQYAFRMRYSAIASPIDNVGANYYPWDFDTPAPNGGSGRDCPTLEAIVTVQFIKDRLIVFCEESTWEIVYTGNQQSPFSWQQINSELGVESTFSVVPFDKVAVGVGNVGVIACTGTNVDRIDDKIPDEVFSIHNLNDGPERVYGIRDYFTEMLYWAFPNALANTDFPYPNRVLVYNYKTGTWAFNDDSITAFGYFQPQTGILWSSTTVYWSSDILWSSGEIQGLFRTVAAGNQQGYTFIIEAGVTTNASVLQITNITIGTPGSNVITITSIDHNLRYGDYIYFQDIQQSGVFDPVTNNLTLLNGKIFPIKQNTPIEDPDSFFIVYQDDADSVIAGTYTGGGTMSRVSQIQLLTKQYNFYMDKGRNAYVSKVDFLMDTTQYGQIEVNFYVSTSATDMLAASNSLTGTGSLLGTGTLETFPYPSVPFEANSSQVWHPVYFQADGEFIQLDIKLNDEQMRDTNIRQSEFQLHAMTAFCQPTSYRNQ